MLLSKNAQGIHYASIEKYGVIRDTRLPVAGYVPLKNIVAELRQRRPGTQAARQALPDNGACGLSGVHIATFCQRLEYRRLAGPWAACNDKAKVNHFSTQVRSPNNLLSDKYVAISNIAGYDAKNSGEELPLPTDPTPPLKTHGSVSGSVTATVNV